MVNKKNIYVWIVWGILTMFSAFFNAWSMGYQKGYKDGTADMTIWERWINEYNREILKDK